MSCLFNIRLKAQGTQQRAKFEYVALKWWACVPACAWQRWASQAGRQPRWGSLTRHRGCERPKVRPGAVQAEPLAALPAHCQALCGCWAVHKEVGAQRKAQRPAQCAQDSSSTTS